MQRPSSIGVPHLCCLPEHMAVQLKLDRIGQREIQTAEGRSHVVDYVGPVRVELCWGGPA
ncbi:MAG: hypothetical protein H7841_11170 [Magnetospirillum sp. WYHS-4]